MLPVFSYSRAIGHRLALRIAKPVRRRRILVVCAPIALLALLVAAPVRAQESVEYYGLDALGSVRVVFDANGNVTGRMDYDPFGKELSSRTGLPSRAYAGLFRDGEAGLDHAEARSYQSRTGRFSSPDQMVGIMFDPQQSNRYAYAANNALNLIDPSGFLAQPGTNESCFNPGYREEMHTFCDFFFSLFFLSGSGEGGYGYSPQGHGRVAKPTPTISAPPTPTVTAAPEPTIGAADGPVETQPDPCSNGAGGGVMVGFGGSVEGGAFAGGGSLQGTGSYGMFYDRRTGFSRGGNLSGGGTLFFSGAQLSSPRQSGTPFVLGGYGGYGPGVTITNAHSVRQTGGPFTTWTFNAGFGVLKGSAQLSYGGGVWEFTLSGGPAPVSNGLGGSFSRIATVTRAQARGCR